MEELVKVFPVNVAMKIQNMAWELEAIDNQRREEIERIIKIRLNMIQNIKKKGKLLSVLDSYFIERSNNITYWNVKQMSRFYGYSPEFPDLFAEKEVKLMGELWGYEPFCG